MIDEEKFREFIVRRPFLHGDGCMISDAEYKSLKARDGYFWSSLDPSRAHYLHGYLEGWKDRK